ncbi:hypothetical protein G3O08_10995 [Cryomorpha ignava]|uniref:Uncharacterized protein n=1 Tax=Cryomorpha ignava TaxID=101383 RepID=A0A7K3WTN9_9FLAO|nr:hypothetical protein [Cryomorpha ignava]NEN24025.1 hypothetical protein [Cryomorpha ignava]
MKKAILLIPLLIQFSILFGQADDPVFSFEQNNAMNKASMQNSNVNLANGAMQISIPLFNLDLLETQIPITLIGLSI